MNIQARTNRFKLPAVEFTFAGFAWPRWVAVMPPKDRAKRVSAFTGMCGPYYHAPKPIDRHSTSGFYLASDGMPGLRWEWAHDVRDAFIGHTGWYTDEYGDSDTIAGLVLRLPGNRGFLAGWSMGANMASGLAYDVHETKREAAKMADYLAQCVAEKEREHQSEYDQECEE